MKAEIRALREGEEAACLDLWKQVWPDRRPGFFERYLYGDADYQPEYIRVACLDGGLVSVAQIVKRVVSCGEFTLTMGGIANVATDPDYRGEGFAQQCVRQAIEVMEADALDFSLLFTGIHDFYTKCGYEPIQGSRVIGELRPDPLHVYTRTVVRPYEDRDDASIHLIHVAYNRERPITVRRSPQYWRDWLEWHRGLAPGRATVAEQEGVVVGYCLYAIDEEAGRLRVREFGVREGAEEAIDGLLEEAAETARAHHIPSMCMPLGDDPTVGAVAARLFMDDRPVEREPIQSAMVRFLDRHNLLRGLAPSLTERWRICGSPEGRLLFSGPYGATAIKSEGPFLRIDAVESGDETAALNQAELFDLLTGQELSGDRLPTEDMRFANALFPPQHRWFWELDGF